MHGTRRSSNAATISAIARSGAGDRAIDARVRTPVPCLDEIGCLSYDTRNADLLLQIVSGRYENKSIVMTINLAFGDCPTTTDSETPVFTRKRPM